MNKVHNAKVIGRLKTIMRSKNGHRHTVDCIDMFTTLLLPYGVSQTSANVVNVRVKGCQSVTKLARCQVY